MSIISALLISIFLSPVTHADDEVIFANKYPEDPYRARSFWAPLGSFFLPGLDQWVEGQYAEGAIYTGYSVAGLSIASAAQDRLDENPGQSDIDSRNNDARQYMVGMQMYQTAGAMSAYQAFHSTAEAYKKTGAFQFLKQQDKVSDIALAPFNLTYLARPTTYIPLGVLLLLVIPAVNDDAEADHYLSGSDVGYLSALSYQAGTGEEAIFRGYLMPSFRQSWGSDFWSNTAQAAIFGAAHISSENRFPLAQALFGWYAGWLTQRNQWSVSEAVFIHVWWDVIAFSAHYLSDRKSEREEDASIYLPFTFTY